MIDTTVSITAVNILSIVTSVVMLIGFTLFFIFVNGRPNSKIHRLPSFLQWSVKLSLGLCSIGSFLNIIYYTSMPASDVVLHVGVSSLMLWASWFHYTTFVIPIRSKTDQKKPIKPIKRKKS